MLERFRKVRDEIELRVKGWLENPEEEFRKPREEREQERLKRLGATRRKATTAGNAGTGDHDSFARA